MTTTYHHLSHNHHPPTPSIHQSIQSLKSELQHSRAQQKRYIIELNTLQSIRTKISSSLEELSANYKKELKSLQMKVKKLQTQNRQLKNKNALYEMEVEVFQKRILEKDCIISSMLGKDFGSVGRSGGLVGRREETLGVGLKNQEMRDDLQDRQKIIEAREIKNRGQVEAISRQPERSDDLKTGFVKKPPMVKKIQQIEAFSNHDDEQNQKPNNKIVESELSPKVDSQKRDFHEIQLTENQDLKEIHQVSVIVEKQGIFQKEGQTLLSEREETNNSNQFNQNMTNDQQFMNPFGSRQAEIFKHQESSKYNQKLNPLPIHQPSSQVQSEIKEASQNSLGFPILQNDVKTTQQSSAQQHKQFAEQTEIISIVPKIPIKKSMPPPPSVKKVPVLSRPAAKKHIKPTKNIPKYKMQSIYLDVEQQPNENQFVLTNDQPQDQSKIVHTIQADFKQQKSDFYHHDIVLNQETKFTQNQLEEKNQQTMSQQKQETETEHREQDMRQETSYYSSTNKSKKGKRHQPRPIVEHGLIDFNQEKPPVPITQIPSSNFFSQLTTNNTTTSAINLAQHQPQQQQTFTPSIIEKPQDDHQMHGLVDESSIEQIQQDASMISNTILFAEESCWLGGERMGQNQVVAQKERKGSTGQEKSSLANQQKNNTFEVVLTPQAPSKKMPKKKAKRQTVQVMDPSSFV